MGEILSLEGCTHREARAAEGECALPLANGATLVNGRV